MEENVYILKWVHGSVDEIPAYMPVRTSRVILKLCHFPRENPSSYKPGSGHQRHHYFHPLTYVKQRDHYQLKYHHLALREKEKEPYEQRESPERSSPPKQESRKFIPAAKCENNETAAPSVHFHSCISAKTHTRTQVDIISYAQGPGILYIHKNCDNVNTNRNTNNY